MIETTVAVGTKVAEVVFVAEFVVGDAVFEVALLAGRGGLEGPVDALVETVLEERYRQ